MLTMNCCLMIGDVAGNVGDMKAVTNATFKSNNDTTVEVRDIIRGIILVEAVDSLYFEVDYNDNSILLMLVVG